VAMRIVLNEEAIASCLSGELAPDVLDRQAEGAIERLDNTRVNIHVRDMSHEFVVTAEMLIRLCDAALERQISAISLSAVAFAMVASDHFDWHDELVAEVLNDWASPEINYPLGPHNLKRFRAWLTRDEPYPERPDVSICAGGSAKIISTAVKISHR
jgi:hypothetical protein